MYRLAKKTRHGLSIGRQEYSTLEDAIERQQYFKSIGIKMVVVKGYGDVIS